MRMCFVGWLGCLVALAGAGPGSAQWRDLPDAVDRLERGEGQAEAERIVTACSNEARRAVQPGMMQAVPLLVETWTAAVSSLPDGHLRQAVFAERIARDLVALGLDAMMEGELELAGRALARAVEISPTPEVLETVRRVTLPPVDPEPGQLWRSVVDGAAFVWHPPLEFRHGCTRNDTLCARNEVFFRWVAVPGLWVQQTETTVEQYARCVDAGGCEALAVTRDDPAPTVPVANVTWNEARSYAQWAGRHLPSEAEYERAARGPTADTRYPWGSRFDRNAANLEGVSGVDRFASVAPVGSFPATGFGVLDIAGNLWEWCRDTYHPNALGAPSDESAWTAGGVGRVIRGGSFRRGPALMRVSVRTWQDATYRGRDVGFRTIQDPADGVSDAWVVRRLVIAFPHRGLGPDGLAPLDLHPDDQVFLERRALTWYVIEGRPEEALGLALSVLERAPTDRVALDLLERVEDRLAGWTVVGRLEALESAMDQIRRGVAGHPEARKRFDGVLRQVAEALFEAGVKLKQRERYAEARERFRLAVLAHPGFEAAAEAYRSARPPAGFRRTWEGDSRAMVWVPAGTYRMGASPGDQAAGVEEYPAHRRRVEGFWLDRHEVTNADYRRCVEAGACTVPGDTQYYDHPNFQDHPVVSVSWTQAWQYAAWAGKRLPSEAEWEYAARAGETARYPWGDEWQAGAANSYGALGADRWGATAPVGEFPANAWGVHDLVGNAAEWVADRWHPSYQDTPRDGRAWTWLSGGMTEPARVVRGGSFESSPNRSRVSRREERAPDRPDGAVGFRCAADASGR